MKKVLATSALGLVALGAHAQSSVTLYGIVDAGIGYQSSQTSLGSTSGGRSVVKMVNGVWAGSRFGLKGGEDLGGGTKAIFQLEQGFNSATGAQGVSGLAFNRQAWVGVTNTTYGTLTAGRQYTAYYTLLSPYSPTTWLTGAYGAHPGDIDSLDTVYRTNNSLVYTSPKFYGFTASGSYSFGGVPGSLNAGSTWSAALQYLNGPFGIAAGFQRINNSTPGGGAWGADSATSNNGAQTGVSAINNGYRTAQAQQRVAVTGGYAFNSQWDVSFSYSNVQYIPGVGSAFRHQATFNTAGAVVHFKPLTALDLAAGYSYTRATESNGISSAARYQQFNLSQYYSLSKRTGLYALEAYQRASGQTIGNNGTSIINATASIGDGQNSAPSSSRSQFAAGVGIIHRF
ncbi:porin [Paraburkholderia sp. 22099]|jgi:predicted porin|uniref:Porin n=1 Tax=Paraburkholderia terricola TaxID=169427 RepID=A0A1M6TU39_9BURK|nr:MULTISPECIES: porin [Paraburkholderia]ORC45852.1 porin [Burkholderia sp. A27]AXE94490.1 porin [Paraburkholderia terricola]MDR6408823.1 putative porin [Paraburkholderia terricola]MDR6448453.1 putative porin [Paraburkholderia terricola]MDR6482276.1 putative porin [Paraburkholderia terricola]